MGWLEDFKSRRAKERTNMRIKLDPEYVVQKADREAKNADGKPASSQKDNTLSQFLVTQALAAKWPATRDSMGQVTKMGEVKDKGDRKNVARVQDALILAIDDDEDHVDLSLDVVEWLYKILDEWGSPPSWANWHETLLDYLEGALHEERIAIKEAKSKSKGNGASEAASSGDDDEEKPSEKPKKTKAEKASSL